MDAPPVQYVTTSDGYDIAYGVSGEGPLLIHVPLSSTTSADCGAISTMKP
jgi:hypothetical protein